jgi:uncharacterized protein YhfF
MVSEAVSNAVKYAEASEVRVRASRRARQVLVDISDDGAGGADQARGTGLRGLADRVEALGGMLEIVSPPGRGTRLLATIPLVPWRSSQDPVLEFGYEGDDGLGEHLIELIRTGRKTAGVSLAREWDLEGGPPRIGQRLPVTDHLGRRRATVEVQRVVVAPFGDVGQDVVRAEGSGLDSVQAWREAQRRFYEQSRGDTAVMLEQPGWRLTDQEPMVITWFRLLDEPEPPPASGPDA